MHRVIATAAILLGGTLSVFALAVPAIEAGGGGHGQCFPSPRDGTNEPVVMEGTCYEPAVLYVEPGTTVEWQQRDVIPHNVTLFGGELVGHDAEMDDGDSVSRNFDGPGVFPYYCSIHPSMIGVIVVGDPASPQFGASLSVQSTAEELRAIADYKQEWLANIQQTVMQSPAPGEEPPAWAKGSGPLSGAGWSEVAVGMGLLGGLVVGLVAVGGGLRWSRRKQ